jgi:predicted dehydrogenase
MILVSGYGRAGRRHTKIARRMGLKVFTIDPNVEHVSETSLSYALYRHPSSTVVIATPPSLHLEQIEMCIGAGVKKILCEKPLCGLGELERARSVADLVEECGVQMMVAYNYRYHPLIINGGEPTVRQSDHWEITCQQYREEWPSWGFLLDHISHSLDMIYMLTGDIRVTQAYQWEDQEGTSVAVYGMGGDGMGFSLQDWVNRTPIKRRAWVVAPKWTGYLGANVEMFSDMWKAFLKGEVDDRWPTLRQALKVQEELECVQALVSKGR